MSPELELVGVPTEEQAGSLNYAGTTELVGVPTEESVGTLDIANIGVELVGVPTEESVGTLNASVEVELVGVPSEESVGLLIAQPPGGVAAEHMDPQDAFGLDLWLLDNAIETQKVAQLVADKLVGGTISTSDIFVASVLELLSGGELRAGAGTIISSAGLSLAPANTFDVAAVAASYKVSDTVDFAGLWFFSEAQPTSGGGFYRGIVARADGNVAPGSGRPGEIFLCATENGNRSLTTSAMIELIAGVTSVSLGAMYVRETLIPRNRFRGTLFGPTSIANGVTQNYSHTYGIVPYTVLAQSSVDGGITWRPVSHAFSGMGWSIGATSTQVSITNNLGGTAQVRGMVIG